MKLFVGGTSGTHYELDYKIAEGSEGDIYTIKNHHARLAKIIKSARLDNQKRVKMTVITQLPSVPNTAWPIETLISDQHIVGYVMPYIENTKPIHHFFAKHDSDYRMRYTIAYNLAQCVQTIHTHGHIIGDINEQNMVVKPDATVWAVDCDSMQLMSHNDIYRCVRTRDEYTPPELIKCNVHTTIRTPNHDAFGLAVLIFQLLMGISPFHGIAKHAQHTATRIDLECLSNFIFPHISNPYFQPPDYSLPFAALPSTIQTLFIKAFTTTIRPTPFVWKQELNSIINTLTKCPNNHAVPAGMPCMTCMHTDSLNNGLDFNNFDPSNPITPVVFVVDTSDAMSESIHMVNDVLQEFFYAVHENTFLKERLEIGYVTGHTLSEICQFSQLTPPKFTTHGTIPLGSAIEFAFELVKRRTEIYRASGVSYYAPIIIIITAGHSSDDLTKAQELIAHHEHTQTIATYIRVAPNANLAQLTTLNKSRRTTSLNAFPLINLLRYLGYGPWGDIIGGYSDDSSARDSWGEF